MVSDCFDIRRQESGGTCMETVSMIDISWDEDGRHKYVRMS